jgi:hypothetical protein
MDSNQIIRFEKMEALLSMVELEKWVCLPSSLAES